MIASNDSTHTDTDADRRLRFRIDDTAILLVVPVKLEETQEMTAESFFPPSASFNLIRELRSIDQDYSSAFRVIGERHSEIAPYLAALNKKIDTIGNAVAENILPEDHCLQSIDLSEGGIGFKHEEKLSENELYAMKIWFHRALIGLSAYIRVVGCNRSFDGGYHISAAFHELPEVDTATVSRHIMAVQAEQRRLEKAQEEQTETQSK